ARAARIGQPAKGQRRRRAQIAEGTAELHRAGVGKRAADRQAAAAIARVDLKIERAAVVKSPGDRQRRGSINRNRPALREGVAERQRRGVEQPEQASVAVNPASAAAETQSPSLVRRAEY